MENFKRYCELSKIKEESLINSSKLKQNIRIHDTLIIHFCLAFSSLVLAILLFVLSIFINASVNTHGYEFLSFLSALFCLVLIFLSGNFTFEAFKKIRMHLSYLDLINAKNKTEATSFLDAYKINDSNLKIIEASISNKKDLGIFYDNAHLLSTYEVNKLTNLIEQNEQSRIKLENTLENSVYLTIDNE